MDKKRVLIVGLESPDVQSIRQTLGFGYLIVHYEILPKIRLIDQQLFVESPSIPEKFLLIDSVIFHGIFENDFDFITLLALWNGPCLPNATGMMDLRLRIPGLVRALSVSKFSGVKRSMVIGNDEYFAESQRVAKWGIWHCGEDKEKFTGNWESKETSVIEEFILGDAVRIMIIGDENWQINLTGDDWLKSIHHQDAAKMAVDNELLSDSRNLSAHFGLQIIGVDYMIGADNQKYLLEVNHIPNVTVFSFINESFIAFAKNWIMSQ